MIRLRCETGLRPREEIKWKAPPDVWLVMAKNCARIQAKFLFANGRRRIELEQVQALHNELDLTALYEAGILELIAWEDHDRTGRLLRIKCADLSLSAALALVSSDLLPETLVTILLAPDLASRASSLSTKNERMASLENWFAESSYPREKSPGLKHKGLHLHHSQIVDSHTLQH